MLFYFVDQPILFLVLGLVFCHVVSRVYRRIREWQIDRRAAILAHAQWEAWTSYKDNCSFCRQQKDAVETGESLHEQVDLAFGAGILFGFATRERGRLDMPLCPLHLKDAYTLEAKVQKLFPHIKPNRDIP